MSLFRHLLSLPSTVAHSCFLLESFLLSATANIDSLLLRFGHVQDIVKRRKAGTLVLAGNFAQAGSHSVKIADVFGRRMATEPVDLKHLVEMVCLIAMVESRALES